MNTVYLSIIAILCISVTVLIMPQANGVPYISPPAKYFNSDIVLIGNVISSTPFSPTYTKYEIQVEQYLKNPQSQDTLTVIASGINKTGFAKRADTIFDVGQRAFLYLKKDQGNNVVWWYSYPTQSLCDPAPTAADMNSTYVKGAGLDYNQLYTGASKSNSYLYAPNQPVIISYDAWNNQFTRKTFDVVFQVKNQTGQILFNDTKQVELKPCIGHQIVNSTFVPKVAGTYDINVIFDNSLIGTTVEIPSLSGTSSDISHASPLKQFKSGIGALDVTCKTGLQLVIKSEDLSPACVTPDTSGILVKRGWTHDNIILPKNMPHIVIPPLNDTNPAKPIATSEINNSSPLQLFLSIDSEYENPAEPISVDIGLNNTGSVPLTLAKSDNWPRNDMGSGLCSNLPFGISILKGYYTEQNMSSAQSLVIYDIVPCPAPTLIKSYTFEPSSSKATQECDTLFSCPGLTDMKAHLVIPDFMYNGQHHSFDVGNYTIVGGDEWGHVVIQHFTEVYTTAYSEPLVK